MAPRQELLAPPKEAVTALGVIAPPPIHVVTPTFDGSLAALFQCVRDRKVDLLDVPLFPICEAYFSYLLQADAKNLDEAAAALAALAYLLERKAWLLLPVEEPEPEIEEAFELPAPTAHEFHAAIAALEMWQEERARCYFRTADFGPDPYEVPYTLGNVSLGDLARAFERLLSRAKPEDVKPLNKPRRSLSDMMGLVLRSLSAEPRTLEELVEEPFTRSEAVYWFLALLELIRLAQAVASLDGDDVRFALAPR